MKRLLTPPAPLRRRVIACGLWLPLLFTGCDRIRPVAGDTAIAATDGDGPTRAAADSAPRPTPDLPTEPAAAIWAGTVRDSGGVQLIANPAGGLWGDARPWRLRETLRIGDAEGERGVHFGRIEGLTMDGAGRIYVLDAHNRNIRIFTAAGALLTSFGRGGAGPGELSGALGGVFPVHGDTILVADLLNSRINWFADDGATSGSYPAFGVAGGISGPNWRLHPDGRLWAELTIPVRGSAAAPAMRLSVVARDLRGQGVDTLLAYDRISGTATAGGVSVPLFAPRVVWGIGTGGELLHAVTTEYRVHERDGDRLVRAISRPVERVAVPRGAAAILTARVRKGMETFGGPPLEVELDVSDGLPVITGVLGGPDQTIWVQRGVSSAELLDKLRGTEDQVLSIQEFGSRSWDVFDAHGRFLGELRMPPGFHLVSIHGTRLLGIWRDDLDVEFVKVLSLETS